MRVETDNGIRPYDCWNTNSLYGYNLITSTSRKDISRKRGFSSPEYCFVGAVEAILYNPNTSINLLGEDVTILKAFDKIIVEIEYSKYILELEEGWDGNNARSIKKENWKNSIVFLINSASLIYSKYYSVVINAPEINPCPDGSIDFSWRTDKARLLINIRNYENELCAFFYGDLKNNKSPIKGFVPITNSDSEHLLIWMKKYLI